MQGDVLRETDEDGLLVEDVAPGGCERRGASSGARAEAGCRRRDARFHDAQAARHFGVALDHIAQVAAEAILVELLIGRRIPQAAGIGRNLVGNDDPHHVVLEQPAALHLEVDEADADAEEEAGEEIVDADGECHDVVDLLRRGPAEGGDVLLNESNCRVHLHHVIGGKVHAP